MAKEEDREEREREEAFSYEYSPEELTRRFLNQQSSESTVHVSTPAHDEGPCISFHVEQKPNSDQVRLVPNTYIEDDGPAWRNTRVATE